MEDDRATRVYGLHGLRLRSPVPLAGHRGSGDDYDLDVLWRRHDGPVPGEAPPGRLVAAVTANGAYLYVATADDGHGHGAWRLRVPRHCEFVIDRGLARIEVQVDPSSDEKFVSVLVAGLALSFVLGLGGHCVLHASAVSVDGVAVAFAGSSGSGKSTLASLLCAAGAAMLTDDLLRIGLDRPEGPVCVGGAPEIRLRQGAVWALDEYAATPPARVTADDRLAVSPTPETAAETRLGLVVLPRLSREATAVELRPVTGAMAVASLASACRVSGWKDPDIMRAQFGAAAELAAAVPVREAVIPWGPEFRTSIAPAFLDFVRRR